MNYAKPEIAFDGSAIAEIRGTTNGRSFLEVPQDVSRDTSAAYEADE